jgi:uncharacterized membrane protein
MWKSPWIVWGGALGLALGGFFDGILLHQILQWHHLLSLVPGMDDLRLQVLWDGYFHALMYLIAVAALGGMWRAHRHGVTAPRASALAGALMLGFGTWHLLDAVLSHWVLGIHRIKLDSPQPLVWDIAWLAIFGLVPLFASRLLLRQGPSRPGSAAAALCLLAALSGAAGAWALRELPGQRFTTVVFAPGLGAAGVSRALEATGARLLWTDRAMGVVVVAVDEGQRWRFYRHGALLVGGTVLAAGCVSASGV